MVRGRSRCTSGTSGLSFRGNEILSPCPDGGGAERSGSSVARARKVERTRNPRALLSGDHDFSLNGYVRYVLGTSSTGETIEFVGIMGSSMVSVLAGQCFTDTQSLRTCGVTLLELHS